MPLTDLEAGTPVFVDANIFIYHFAGLSEECSAFLARVSAGHLRGVTGQFVVLEVLHRLMMLEAAERRLTEGSNPAARLARRPDVIGSLSRYYFAALRIWDMGVEVLPLPEQFVTASQEFRQSYGLLVNDSLVPAQMRQAGVSVLASSDTAFDRIPGIRRVAPSDI